jgi:hypothetical protein
VVFRAPGESPTRRASESLDRLRPHRTAPHRTVGGPQVAVGLYMYVTYMHVHVHVHVLEEWYLLSLYLISVERDCDLVAW